MRIGIGTSIVGSNFIGGEVQYLDEVGGTPTAAYSVDKVVSTYTDAVVRVRRASDNEEADVAFDNDTITLDSAVDNFDTGSLSTTLGEFVAASGYSDPDSLGSPDDAFVATWYDQAGSNDATQITAADQPQIVSSGVLVTENGKVALDCNSDFFTVTGSQGNFTYLHDGTSSSVFITATCGKTANPDNILYIIGNNRSSASSIGIGIYYDDRSGSSINDALGVYITNFGIVSISFPNDTLTSQNQSLISSFIDADNVDLASRSQSGINGGILFGDNTNNTAPSSSNSSQSLQIGASGNSSFPMSGFLQEIIIYNSDKSALRTDIEDNINDRFSIYA